MSPALFKTRTVVWIATLSGLSLLIAVFITIFQEDLVRFRSHKADTYSRSAIGHHGLVELLNQLDVPVVVSGHHSGMKAGLSAALLILEPRVISSMDVRAQMLDDMLIYASSVLVVLPKWSGTQDPTRWNWITDARPVSKRVVDSLLVAIGVEGELVRLDEHENLTWSSGSYDATPSLSRPQLLRSSNVHPLCECEEGVLLGEVEPFGTRVMVLTDPDILSNHGLGRGENALLVMRILDDLRDDGAPIVIDETIHGYQVTPSIWRPFFQFPLALVGFQVLLAAGALLWMALGRFGAPARSKESYDPSKGFLIDNTAELLQFGGHHVYTLRRYVRSTMLQVAKRLRIPQRLTPVEVKARLQKTTRARGIELDIEALEKRTEEMSAQESVPHHQVLDIASEFYRWRQEMIDGS